MTKSSENEGSWLADVPRDQRQQEIAIWARQAFGEIEATDLPQRGVRLLEEAIEAFQACGGNEEVAHKLVSFVFKRPPGTIGQELGGIALTVFALAAAAGLSADEEEQREIHRVLSKPVAEFTARNASKNAAGFKLAPEGVPSSVGSDASTVGSDAPTIDEYQTKALGGLSLEEAERRYKERDW